MSYRSGKLWSKFYWKDWQTDKALRMCSLAARGLWMEMLCIMHDSEPYGHLTNNVGGKLSDRELSILANVPFDIVEVLTAELLEKGVCSRTSDGVIYCRRMIVEKQRSDVGKDFANKRWNNPKRPKTLDKKQPITKRHRGTHSKQAMLEAEAEAERVSDSASDSASTPPGATLGGYAPSAITDDEKEARFSTWQTILVANDESRRAGALAEAEYFRRKRAERKADPAWQSALKKYGGKITEPILVNGDEDIPL